MEKNWGDTPSATLTGDKSSDSGFKKIVLAKWLG